MDANLLAGVEMLFFQYVAVRECHDSETYRGVQPSGDGSDLVISEVEQLPRLGASKLSSGINHPEFLRFRRVHRHG